MRLSIDDGSSSKFGPALVYLNGTVLDNMVLMADEENGLVEVIARDRTGRARVVDGELEREIRRGCVRIEAIPAAPAHPPAQPTAPSPVPAPSPPPAPKSPFTQDSAGQRYQTGPGFRDDA